jgi:NAD(P)-dependent dehydrogenase (short-subunit alcohol dehydrogenase family)
MNELTGKVAIITGGGSGIGSSMARTFAEEGASVVVADISMERAEKVAEMIKKKGGAALPIQADVTKTDDVKGMVKKTLEKFGRIDILVNNAGMGYRSGAVTTSGDLIVENLDEQLWDKVITTNLKSAFLCSQAVIPSMKKQKSGNIVNIASGAAFSGAGAKGGSGAHYNASKAALVNLTKTLAVQLGPYGIRANTIAPSLVYAADADGTHSASFGAENAEDMERIMKLIPLGRLGTPKDVANAAVFLASDKNSYIHGATLHVNGGCHME